jgi:flagellar biosynthesis protein FlhG
MQQPEARAPELAPPPVQVIAVTGGKGGTGKTAVSVNLATAFARAGRSTMLLDGDLGLANVDVLLGLTPRCTLEQVLSGERRLEEVILETSSGVRVVPAASGVARMAALSASEQAAIVHAFSTLPGSLDVLIVDTAAGISERCCSSASRRSRCWWCCAMNPRRSPTPTRSSRCSAAAAACAVSVCSPT